jgi:hypothetical protein
MEIAMAKRGQSAPQGRKSFTPMHEADSPLKNAAHLFILAENFTAL